jgi:predicted amidohydrolase
MFDVDVGDVSYRESAIEEGGDRIELGDVNGTKVGLTICYDLRFPELYRILALRGARVITVPSAFTERTGRDHWEVLIRARAIENQVFVVAAGQIGSAPPQYRSYGRSMIVDPWGVVLAQAADTECFVSADLDFAIQDDVRDRLPSLRHRRPEAYSWPEDAKAEPTRASTQEAAIANGAA